jgi:hypothetical protein
MKPVPSWLRFLLGLGEDDSIADGVRRWELPGLPRGAGLWLAALLLAGAVVLIVVLYRRERVLGPWKRLTLGGLRVLALALVVLALLDPRLVTEVHAKRPARTLVLVDGSSSMEQRDRYERADVQPLERATGLDLDERPSRAALVSAAMARHRVLDRLAERNQVSLYAFGAGLVRAAGLDAPALREPSGAETRIGEALESAGREAGLEPVAAILLVSDGRQNAGIPALDLLRDPTRWRSAPIHAVAVGKPEDFKNAAVIELAAPESVEAGYPVEIEAGLRIAGLREGVEVVLRRHAVKGGARVEVERRRVEGSGPSRQLKLRFIDTLPEKGAYVYTLEVPPHPEETTKQDNRREVRVLAADELRRALVVAGGPSPLYHFVRDFFIRDTGIEVACWLSGADKSFIQDGDVHLKRLPDTERDLEPYDAVILIDPDPSSLGAAFLESLFAHVTKRGGGLAYVAGEFYTPRLARDSRLSMLHALLPVGLNAGAPPIGNGQFHVRPWRPRLTAAGENHPLCRLANEAELSRKIFETLHPFYFAHPSAAGRPGALTLLQGEAETIVLATQSAGFGECVYLGTDEFWRWRPAGLEPFERFFAGLLRYLASGKRAQGKVHYSVETDRDRYRPGELVRVQVEPGRGGQPAPELELTIERLEESGPPAPGEAPGAESAAGAAKVAIKALPPAGAGPGPRLEARFRAGAAGKYRIVIGEEEKTSFDVLSPSTEWQDPSPDFQLLEDLAVSSGGSFCRLADVAALPDRIPDGTVTEIIGRRSRTVWDSAALMVLFALLLTAEWGLRKLWHLN